jgi:xanthine/uracil permease
MFANTVVIPISIGAAFHLSSGEITVSLQRSFLYTGIACLLQAFLGHRLPLMEGQSGLWWGVILSLCAAQTSSHLSLVELGGSLAIGIVLSGILISVLGFLGIGRFLNKIFTPIVMSVFLFLLASQLILIFFKGMIGLASGSHLDLKVTLLSLFLVVLISWINLKGRGAISNFSLLIGILVGWIAYSLFFPVEESLTFTSVSLFEWFPWGKPVLQMGFIITAVLTGLINTTNTVAAMRGSEPLFECKMTDSQYRRSYMLTGLNTVVSGVFGLVPYAPYTSSIGFLQSTRILDRASFVIGSALFMALGLIPPLSAFFSTLPISVGDAVLFVAYLQLFGSALRNIEGIEFNSRTIYRIAGPTLIGIALLNVPATAFGTLPALIRPLISNGLLVGIFLAILLENLVNWSSFEKGQNSHVKKKVS